VSRPDPTQLTGETVAGRYPLGRVIGDGGYGVVYEANDLSSGAAVAVKLCKRLDAEKRPAAEQAMRREANVRLFHPNIASPIDGGEHRDSPFVACTLASGQTVQSALTSGWVPDEMMVANVLVQTLDATQACHDAGLMHRDLSSRNILLDRPTGRATVIDFGSVYRLNDPDQRREPHFHATPGLIPAEMLRAGSPEPGPPQDVFAIGTLGYELVTGVPPFIGATPEEVNQAVADGTRVPIQQIVPHANPHLINIIDRLMAHRVSDRYASAREAIHDLTGISGYRTPHAAAPPTSSSALTTARCSYCGHRANRPSCQTCGRPFIPGVVINLWESVIAVHSVYFVADEEHVFGRTQVDPHDRTISRQQLVITAGANRLHLRDGGSVNPTTIQGVSPGGMAKPGTTLFTFGRYTGHLVSA